MSEFETMKAESAKVFGDIAEFFQQAKERVLTVKNENELIGCVVKISGEMDEILEKLK